MSLRKSIIDYDSENDIIFMEYAGMNGVYAKIISHKTNNTIFLSFMELKEIYKYIKRYIPSEER